MRGKNIFIKYCETETHQLAETSGTYAASDAGVAAKQNLPGSAVVGQIVFVGVSHRLGNIEIYLMLIFYIFLTVNR